MPVELYTYLLIQIATVSYIDYREKRISNNWLILNCLSFFILSFFYNDFILLSWQQVKYSFVFFVVGLFLFIIKIMGGGDSKYLASLFLLIPSTKQDQLVEILIYTTIVVGILFFIKNTFQHKQELKDIWLNKKFNNLKLYYGKKIAFAPVIFLSWIIFSFFIFEEMVIK